MPRRHSPEEFRFDARYGRLIRKAGIGTIPFALFAYQAELKLQPQEVWFIAYILAHRWTSELPFPSLARMARTSGLTKRALRNYKDSLVAKGFLVVVERQRPDGGTTSHGYDFSPLFDLLDRCITRDLELWSRRNPQFLEEAADAWDDEDEPADPPGEQAYPPPGEQGGPGAGKRVLTGRRKAPAPGPGDTGSPQEEDPLRKERNRSDNQKPARGGRQAARAVSTDPSRSSDQATREGKASAPPQPAPGPRAEDGGAMVDTVADYASGLLHDDPGSRKATRTRVRRLWTLSGLSADAFVALLHDAVHRTQQASGNIRLPAGDGAPGLKNKVPYFLQVLENLVGGAEPSQDDPREMLGQDRTAETQGTMQRVPGRGATTPDIPVSRAGDEVAAVWAAALVRLREQMTAANFATWLEGTRAVGWDGDTLIVGTADGFTREWLELRLAPLVRRTVQQLTHAGADVAFVVAGESGSPLHR